MESIKPIKFPIKIYATTRYLFCQSSLE